MSRTSPTSRRRLPIPGTAKAALRPDLSGLLGPARTSGAPLTPHEVDYDDLVIHRTWRAFHDDRPGEVKYFMYEVSQRNPGDSDYWHGFKAVRLLRLTRVPRYLRQSGASDAAVFAQQRDLLAALREQNVLFLNLIAKSPTLPLVFAYGVQAVGSTPQEAQQLADRSFAVLTYQLDGTYQQLQHAPLTLEEGETLARFQAEWRHIAVGRGRPLPTGGYVGGASLLDGNRTDVDSNNNQLESFIRGMGDKSFMLSLVTVPLAVEDMTRAWRNLSTHLSKVRSDQSGSRSVHAGVALPLAMGASVGDQTGNSHSTGTSQAVTDSQTSSASLAQGTSSSMATAVSQTDTTTTGVSASQGVSSSESVTQTQGQSTSVADSQNRGVTGTDGVSLTDTTGTSQNRSEGLSVGQSTSQSINESHSSSASTAVGTSVGQTNTASTNQTQSVSQGQSSAYGQSVGNSWQNSMGQSVGSSIGQTDGFSSNQTQGTNQSLNYGTTNGSSQQTGTSQSAGDGVSGSVAGFGGNANTSSGTNQSSGTTSAHTQGITQGGSNSHTQGVSSSQNVGQSQGVNWGESFGGNTGQSMTNTNTVGSSQSVGVGQSVASSVQQSATNTQGVSHSVGQSATAGTTTGQNVSQGQSISNAQALAQSHSMAQSASTGRTVGYGESFSEARGMTTGTTSSVSQSQSVASSEGLSRTATDGVNRTATEGISQGVSQQRALQDAYQVAMSRTASQTSSLGVAPSVGVSISKNTYDEAKRVVGDMLEAQMRRYLDGIEGGAMLYQMFLVCPDPETLAGGSGLLKSAFWGPGSKGERLPQPFHTIDRFSVDDEEDQAERERLLLHARAFTSYRRRETVTELIEPFRYSSFITPGEASAFCHPPTAEASGLLAVHDSMPVLALPSDRANRDIYLGHLVNGERGQETTQRFGVDFSELVHTLVSGITGSGKTTTLMRMLAEIAAAEREVTDPPTATDLAGSTRTVRPSILALDWMRNMRDLAGCVPADRFRFYSLLRPECGKFAWNPLAIPAHGMAPAEWLNAQADNFTAAMSLGEFGRSLIAEFLTDLYSANRLEDFELCPAVVDGDGVVHRPAVILSALDPATIPPEAIRTDAEGRPYANVFTHPALSRCVGLTHLASLVVARVEEMATTEAARASGTAMRDRLQSLWRRIGYFAPGGQFEQMLAFDPDLNTRVCLEVTDLIDTERGIVSVIETEGLDKAARRLVLGSVLLAVFRYGLHHGEGTFDQQGRGLGAFVVMEESHELFGSAGRTEDEFTATARVDLYESMFRRSRALGMRLIAVAQNVASLPEAITSNTGTVIVHRTQERSDRDRVFSTLNWVNAIGMNQNEYKWLGMLPTGHCIVRLSPTTSWLQAAPVNLVADPAPLARVTDQQLAALARAQHRAG